MSTEYNATAGTTTPLDAGNAGHLLDVLADYHPAVGRSPFARTEVTITVPAESLRQAVTTALALITVAAGPHDVVSLEVLTAADFDRRLGLAPIPELLSVAETAAELGVSRQAVQQRIDSGSLPATRIGSTWAIPRAAVVEIAHGGGLDSDRATGRH